VDVSRVLGVLNGNEVQASWLRSWMDSATLVVAADGGARHVLAAGRSPDFVIGDLDSFKESGLNMSETVILERDQNTSDCDKLLAFVAAKNARFASLICVEGDRLDHVLATLSSCVAASLEIRLIMPRNLAWIIQENSSKNIQIERGRKVSVIPLGRATVSLTGTEWPLEKAEVGLGGLVSLSNVAAAGAVECTVHEGAVALFSESRPGDAPTW